MRLEDTSTVLSLSLSLSLSWPSTGLSAFHADRFVASLQASEGESPAAARNNIQRKSADRAIATKILPVCLSV